MAEAVPAILNTIYFTQKIFWPPLFLGGARKKSPFIINYYLLNGYDFILGENLIKFSLKLEILIKMPFIF